MMLGRGILPSTQVDCRDLPTVALRWIAHFREHIAGGAKSLLKRRLRLVDAGLGILGLA